ncbi:MAG: segregation and condensation protein A [Candidatus Limnocylindrales bacterium]
MISLPPTAVRFVDEPRPELGTLVQVATFDGPLGLLLSLIEQRQLDILTVPLGELASAYLEALATLPSERLPHLSTFVSVAANLILIKSRAMLPSPPALEPVVEDAPDPESELRDRLLLYRRFRDAGGRLGSLLAAPEQLFHREAAAAASAAVAGARLGPQPPMDPVRLVAALAGLAAIAPPPVVPPQVMARVVTLAERAAVIRAALAHAPTIVLQDLLGDGRDRVFMAVTFMALLELVKRREVRAVQAVPWGPIECRLA